MTADPARFPELFPPRSRVLVVIRPDPDAIASALAVAHILRKRAREVVLSRVGTITRLDNLAMIRVLDIRLRDHLALDPAAFDAAVIVDSQPSHFDPGTPMPPLVAVIDHHPPGPGLEGIPWVDIRPDQGSCATILEEYLNRLDATVTPRLATALCFGIKSDTGDFSRGVCRRDAVAFSRLFPRADHDDLRAIERWEIPVTSLPYVRTAFDRLHVGRATLISYLGRVEDPDILVIVADFLSRVGGITLCAVAALGERSLSVVFRGQGSRRTSRGVAIAAFAALGSAGGHRGMARAEVALEAVEREAGGLDREAVERWLVDRIMRAGARRRRPGA